jgi:hypothetical protein
MMSSDRRLHERRLIEEIVGERENEPQYVGTELSGSFHFDELSWSSSARRRNPEKPTARTC